MRTQLLAHSFFLCLLVLLALPGIISHKSAWAQPLLIMPSDSTLVSSVDSLRAGIHNLSREREQMISELRRLSSQVSNVEQAFASQINRLQLRHDTLDDHLDLQFEALVEQLPDEEQLLTAIFYIQYLNQRQDSLIAYVEKLESELEDLPDKHYWGVRNDFKEFDHLLLFTFLGAIMSLGLVLLLRGDNKHERVDSTDHLASYVNEEDHIDRLSMSITLLVGSILVLLFIIFIL